MVSLSLPPNFVWPPLSKSDIMIGSIAYGWTLGFGFLTARNAWKQFVVMRRPLKTSYFWFVLAEFLGSQVMALLFLLLNADKIAPSFAVFFALVTTWVFQVQLLLQIIINRIAIVASDPRQMTMLKWAVFGLVGLVNVSVYVIWIPAHMEISPTWIKLNDIWDRIEKVIYLFIDLALNILFIRTVRQRLVKNGLRKYNQIVDFNIRIIIISLLMDVLLIASMSFTGGVVYGTIHPVTYLVKLNIELSLAKLITMIAKDKSSDIVLDQDEDTGNTSVTASRSHHRKPSVPYLSEARHIFSSHNRDEANQGGPKYELQEKVRGESVVVKRTQEVTITNSIYQKDEEEGTISRSDSETRLKPTTPERSYSVKVSSRNDSEFTL